MPPSSAALKGPVPSAHSSCATIGEIGQWVLQRKGSVSEDRQITAIVPPQIGEVDAFSAIYVRLGQAAEEGRATKR